MDRRRLTGSSTSPGDLSKTARGQANEGPGDREAARETPRGAAVTEPRIERIARRAHELYEARGGTHGRALEDWLQAEREIDAES